MRTPEEILESILLADTFRRAMAAAVAALSDDELLRVSGHLAQGYSENGPTGELLGICLIERSARWERRIMQTTEFERGGDE